MIDTSLTNEQIAENNRKYDEIQKFVSDTYNSCLKLGISISMNIKNGRIEWHK